MFSTIAIASLISLGIVLLVFLTARIVRPGLSFESIHFVLAAIVLLLSTIAASLALVNADAKKALDEKIIEPSSHVYGLSEKRHNIMSIWRAFDSTVPDMIENLPNHVDSLVEARMAHVRAKLNQAIWIHSIVLVIINILFFVVLIRTGVRYRRDSDDSGPGYDDLDDFSPSSTGYTFDDSDI